MAPLRLRHPQGTATIEINLEDGSTTVQDLLQAIKDVTNILPSRQILKVGYPPEPLDAIPELPIDSLGLKRGDQIIVSETPGGRPTEIQGAPPTAVRAPAPSAAPSRGQTNTSASGPDHVSLRDGSFLIHRIVPDDNSCLFTSVALVFEQSMSKAQDMRKLIAQGINDDPEKYNAAILGMEPSQYISTISKPSSWGGAIELNILAAHYGTEIASIDVETGRIDYFTPEIQAKDVRCILLYSGIHYDAVSVAPMIEAPDEWHQTLFPITASDDSDPILVAAKKLAEILRAKKAYTNTATFDLKCEQCGQGLKGEKGARAHAEQTGHTRFGEY